MIKQRSIPFDGLTQSSNDVRVLFNMKAIDLRDLLFGLVPFRVGQHVVVLLGNMIVARRSRRKLR